MTAETVNASELARWMGGVSRQYIGDLAKRGIIRRAPDGNYPLFDSVVALLARDTCDPRHILTGKLQPPMLVAERSRPTPSENE